MQWLTSLLGWLINPLGALSPQRRWQVISWTVHILLVLLVVVGLGVVNHLGGLDRVLRTQTLGLHRVWLPLLFLLGYALYWLIRWLYWLLGPDGAAGEFDDIETAWRQARGQIDEAGIGLNEAPLFLVLGKTAGSLETFFAASRLPFQIRHVPQDADGPLHVYANREAIFVTCEGASLLPVQISRLLESTVVPEPAAAQLDEFLAPPDLTPVLEPALPTEDETQPTPVQHGAVLLLGEPEPAPDQPIRPQREPLLKDLEQVELATRRLRHVCKILLRERQPYCPLNGIILLIPLAATNSPDDTSETAAVIRHDLEVARGALQQDSPRIVVMGDAEQLPGFAEIIHHFPPNSGPQWVLGQHFPLAPDVNASQVPAIIESGLNWTGDTLLPLVISKLWRREGEEGVTDRTSAIEANMQLYEFLNACRQRLSLLGRLGGRAVHLDGLPPLLAGCYLAGTGPDAGREQGFLAGVFRRAIEQQNAVRWTDDATRDNAAYHRYALVGYILLTIFIIVIILLLIAWW